MTFRTLFIGVACFFAGMVTYALLDGSIHSQDLASHRRIVEEFSTFTKDPRNWHPETGAPTAPMPPLSDASLAILVEAGELAHVDLVFPNVPSTRATTRHWMRWADEHEDVVMVSENHQHEFQVSGKRPVHLNIWFREGAQPAVQQLITDLEQFARESVSTEPCSGG